MLVHPRFTGIKQTELRRTAALARSAALLRDGELPAPDPESGTAEFRELAESAGARVVGSVEQRRARPDPATLLGSGKVEEIAGAAASAQASVILVDYDLSPTQLRNLEDALPAPVVDRTQLILDIFARRARTREGQLQVELAQLEYMLPRLTGRGRAMSQLGGGIGTRGPGKRSSKPTGGASASVWSCSAGSSNGYAVCAGSSGRAGSPRRCRRWPWWVIPTRAKVRCSTC